MGSGNGLNDLLLVFAEGAVEALKKSRDLKREGRHSASQLFYGEYVAYYRVCSTLRRIIAAGEKGGEIECLENL